MEFWLIAGLAVLLLSIYIDAAILLPSENIWDRLKARDAPVEPSLLAQRAKRATRNLLENMPFFVTLGLMALIVAEANMAQAVLGAQIFVLARLAYIVAYLAAIPFLRSGTYTVSMLGLALMLLAVL